MTKKRTNRAYTQEFKKEAVALVTNEGYSVAKAAESLGIRANLLYRWKDNEEAQNTGAAPTSEERAELVRLRKEVKELRMEKEILKKASAFFAKEMK